MHVPVLAEAAMHWLQVREDGIYVDCTAGAGGHSRRIAERLTTGRLIAVDRDPAAVEIASKALAEFSNAEVLHRNMDELEDVLKEKDVDMVDGVLIDAGVSSMQLNAPGRGFSFQEEGPLDMRMDATSGESAKELLGRLDAGALTALLKEYGDVGPAKRIAQAICQRRDKGALETTRDLHDAVVGAVKGVKHPADQARKAFQAIRIVVNGELDALASGLHQGIAHLAGGGRLVCITFHSGEDRIAKRIFNDAGRKRRELEPDGRVRRTIPPTLRVLTPKPITPSEEEIRANPRAHSAKLRAAERIDRDAA